MQKKCIRGHYYDVSLSKCPFCGLPYGDNIKPSVTKDVNSEILQNPIASHETVNICKNGHMFPVYMNECPYCAKEAKIKDYMDSLCLGCMTYLDRPDLPCPVCGWDNKKDYYVYTLSPRSVLNKRYMVGTVIGEDLAGIEYIGWDIKAKRKIAIKEFYPYRYVKRTSNRSMVQPKEEYVDFYYKYMHRFLDIIHLFYGLNHPNLVHIYDVFNENNTVYCAMELLDGLTLNYFIKSHIKLSIEETINFLTPIFKALEYIHLARYIHGNLNTESIVFTNSSEVKLKDFLVIRINDDNIAPPPLPKHTADAWEMFTEYGEGGRKGAWSDVYSLAYIIYQSIVGMHPPSSIERALNDTLQAPSKLGVTISKSQEKALLKGLAVNPKDRYQTMREFYNALIGVQDADKETSNVLERIKKKFANIWK